MSRPKQACVVILAVFFAASWFCGCGKTPERPEDLPELFATELKVNSYGGPVADAKITLVPADGSKSKWSCGGTTNKHGVAYLKTLEQFTGVPEGEYKVLVQKTEGNPPAFDLVDQKFKNALTTTLQVEIMRQKLNSVSVDVGSPVHVEIK